VNFINNLRCGRAKDLPAPRYNGLHANYPLFVSDLDGTRIFSSVFRKKNARYKLSWVLSSGSRVIPLGRTDMKKVIDAFRNSAKANSNYFSKQHERGRLHKRRNVLCSVPTGFTGTINVNVTCMAKGTQRTSLGGPYLRCIKRQKAVKAKACRITWPAVSGQGLQNYTTSGVTQTKPQHAQRQEASADGRHDFELNPETGCIVVCTVQESS